MFEFNRERVYDTMRRTLDFCDVEWGDDGVRTNIDEWENNKAAVVELLRKHPQWNEDALAIITTEEAVGCVDANEVNDECSNLYSLLSIHGHRDAADRFCALVTWRSLATPVITSDIINSWNGGSSLPVPKIGQKTTRWLLKVFKAMGVDVDKDYFRVAFQRLADRINVKSTKSNLVISVNPADYLTMSYGTNWASCHIINPSIANTQRGSSYDGCYKAGCLSYLGDESSIITYTVREIPSDITDLPITPRLTREMFFVNNVEHRILQSRLYPYVYDESVPAARRNIMQKIMAYCWNVENKFDVVRNYVGFTTHYGSRHYRDYAEYSTRWNSVHKSSDAESVHSAIIGNLSYCLVCGDEFFDSEFVHCSDCSDARQECPHCGADIDDDNVVYWHGETFCANCCTYCEWHEQYEPDDYSSFVYVNGYGWVCDDALSSGEFLRHYVTGEWYGAWSCPHWIDINDEEGFCDAEDANNYDWFQCTDCGEWFCADRGGYASCEADVFYCEQCFANTDVTHCECGAIWPEGLHRACPNCGVVPQNKEKIA